MGNKQAALLNDVMSCVSDLKTSLQGEKIASPLGGVASYSTQDTNTILATPGWYYFGIAPPMDTAEFWNKLNHNSHQTSMGLADSCPDNISASCISQANSMSLPQRWEPVQSQFMPLHLQKSASCLQLQCVDGPDASHKRSWWQPVQPAPSDMSSSVSCEHPGRRPPIFTPPHLFPLSDPCLSDSARQVSLSEAHIDVDMQLHEVAPPR